MASIIFLMQNKGPRHIYMFGKTYLYKINERVAAQAAYSPSIVCSGLAQVLAASLIALYHTLNTHKKPWHDFKWYFPE